MKWGALYGLKLDDSKLEILYCYDGCEIDLGDRTRVKKKAGVIYLGVLITVNGKLRPNSIDALGRLE